LDFGTGRKTQFQSGPVVNPGPYENNGEKAMKAEIQNFRFGRKQKLEEFAI
jgi:hypothetical protein